MALVMNQSLTPTKLDSNEAFSPSNYPDKRSLIAAYKRMVQMVLNTQNERATLQKILKEFHSTQVVEDLIENLRALLSEPKKRQLYLYIRPLIPARLRQEYNTLIPHIPSFKKKVVHLKQQGRHCYGFSVRGGSEFGCGIYVTSVVPSSKAAQYGLKAGDEILRVNGLTLSESTHEEIVNLIKLKKTLTLTVRAVGLLPEKREGSKVITWKTVAESNKKKQSGSRLENTAPIVTSVKRIQVSVEENSILGVSIKTDNANESGVFIVGVVPNSAADNAGLKAGNEIVEVNGHSLINVPHNEAIHLLKSSQSLMLTIQVEEPSDDTSTHTGSSSSRRRRDRPTGGGGGGEGGPYDPLANPPEDFEIGPNDFDIDAELIPTAGLDESTGFTLRQRTEDAVHQMRQRARLRQAHLSVLGVEMEQSLTAPQMASPAAMGYGPTLAIPSLTGMVPQHREDQMDGGQNPNDNSLISVPTFSPEKGVTKSFTRESMALDLSDFSGGAGMGGEGWGGGEGGVPTSFANIFPAANTGVPMFHVPPPPPTAPPPPSSSHGFATLMLEPTEASLAPSRVKHNISGADLASYQFPVDEDEEEPNGARKRLPSLDKQPSFSSLKKSPSETSLKGQKGARARKPAFKESVEIISMKTDRPTIVSNGSGGDFIHPSNMDFSDDVLKGREVAFHTIPKDGPMRIAIRGGTDTPLGGQIIISQILAGGAAEIYGKLNVGDQLLVCDGISLTDVTHEEAAKALKEALDMESTSIDIVVAVNPEVESSKPIAEPETVWPLKEEQTTVLDEHPAVMATIHDYARSSHRSHSGFTLRGKDRSTAHAFLPRLPNESNEAAAFTPGGGATQQII